MRIFFLASISAPYKLKAVFPLIIREIEGYGNEVIYEHVLDKPTNVQKLTSQQLEERAKRLSKEMLSCECVVFEGTHPSTGSGFLLSQATKKNIPTLFLTQEKYSGLYLADRSRLLVIKYYHPEKKNDFNLIIKKFLKFAQKKKLSNRFNLMISDSMNKYIGKCSKNNNTSKADFLRNLVYEKMRNENAK